MKRTEIQHGRGITVTMAVRARKCESSTVPILSNEKKCKEKKRRKMDRREAIRYPLLRKVAVFF